MKSNREWMELLKDKCNMKHGLALLWKEGISMKVQTFSQTHIDAFVDNEADVGRWHLTGF